MPEVGPQTSTEGASIDHRSHRAHRHRYVHTDIASPTRSSRRTVAQLPLDDVFGLPDRGSSAAEREPFLAANNAYRYWLSAYIRRSKPRARGASTHEQVVRTR